MAIEEKLDRIIEILSRIEAKLNPPGTDTTDGVKLPEVAIHKKSKKPTLVERSQALTERMRHNSDKRAKRLFKGGKL